MAEWNRNTPWRQGHLLSQDAITALGLRHAARSEQTVVIVASHDCDLAQAPEGEPKIEIVIGCLVTDKDGNCTHAKNARKLHVEFVGGDTFWAEFEATAKSSIEKLKLNEFYPRSDVHLTAENHTIFQMWLASRYRRSAFPDEFERRLTQETKLADKIAKAVRPHGELITGVFFDVDEGAEVVRSGPDDTYTLDISILYDPDVDAAEHAADEVANTIKTAFKDKLFTSTQQWLHIELRFCEHIAESTLSYADFKRLKRWRLEHISLAADPQQSVLAE